MCDLEGDSQLNALSCLKVTQHLDSTNQDILKPVQYDDLFSSPNNQLHVTIIFQPRISIRQMLLKTSSN